MNVCDIKISPACNFGARSAQIKDAQWVCHKVNSRFAHASSSKLIPSCNKIVKKQHHNKNDFHQILSLDKLYTYLKTINLDLYKEQDQRLIKFIQNNIWNISEAREFCLKKYKGHRLADILPYLNLVEQFKVGNCYEDSTITEMILNLNGIKNTCTGKLMCENKDLDHAVCLVNTSEEIFDKNKKLNKKTIIIDSWLGKTDYANNMLLYYKHACSHLFDINDESKITVKFLDKHYFSDPDINYLREMYPDLLYNNKHKSFMNKNSD